jgi:hypothetical protein
MLVSVGFGAGTGACVCSGNTSTVGTGGTIMVGTTTVGTGGTPTVGTGGTTTVGVVAVTCWASCSIRTMFPGHSGIVEITGVLRTGSGLVSDLPNLSLASRFVRNSSRSAISAGDNHSSASCGKGWLFFSASTKASRLS